MACPAPIRTLPTPWANAVSPGSSWPPKVALHDVLENAPAAIFVKDAGGRYVYVNRQHEVVTGISSDETIGHTDFDLFPSAIAAAYRKHDLETLERMSPLQFEEPVLVEGSERVFSVLEFPVVAEKEVVGLCGISIDITEHPREEKRAGAEQQSRADVFFGRLLSSLTPQEVRVLDLLATGLSDREIAEKLSLSSDTVRHHVSHLLKKLRKRRAQVIIEMLKRGSA